MKRGLPWTPLETEILRSMYPTATVDDMVWVLVRRGPKAIKSRANVLKVRRAIGNGGCKKWTAEENASLRQLYPGTKSDKLAERFGVPLHVLYQHARRLGLSKSAEYMRSADAIAFIRPGAGGEKFRFRKGQIPQNKGLRRPGYAPGRMRETQFKKGQAPQNTMPIWSFRFVDGYLMLKTGAPTPKPTTGWEYVHKLVWEHANGPLPDWKVARLWWKDGDHGNCSLSNLELVTAAEHMRRTTIHNLPAPLKQVIQLTGALKRKINNREKKQNGQEYVAGSAGPPVRNARIAV